MKKLLFTAIAAAGMAFGLRAELASDDGTSFEGVTAPLSLADAAASMTKLGSGSFTLPTQGDPTLTVTAYGQGEALEHVDAYGTGAQANYLAVKTSFGNPLTWNLATPTAADGIYFDSLVKFTAMDADDTVQAGEGAKLAVYLKNNADETETHVFVHAGTLGGAAQEYDCGAITDADAWHRLTIKTIDDDIAGVAFVVFINKVALKCNTSKGFGDLGTEAAFWNGANALFPSLLPDDSTIASVGFDGQLWRGPYVDWLPGWYRFWLGHGCCCRRFLHGSV